jgi:hypothetical protein
MEESSHEKVENKMGGMLETSTKSERKKPGRPKRLKRTQRQASPWEISSSSNEESADSTSEAEWEDYDLINFADEEEDDVFPLSSVEVSKVIDKIKENQEKRRIQREQDKIGAASDSKSDEDIDAEEQKMRKRLKLS